MKCFGLHRHAVRGDGSCMYHTVAHLAGLIVATGHGDCHVTSLQILLTLYVGSHVILVTVKYFALGVTC